MTIIGVILLFANLGVAYIALKNIDALPELIQNESAVFTILLLSEILDVILSFVFAFRVQKIRIKTMEEYREKQAKDKIENQFLKVQNCWVNSKNSVHAGVRNFYYYIYA